MWKAPSKNKRMQDSGIVREQVECTRMKCIEIAGSERRKNYKIYVCT